MGEEEIRKLVAARGYAKGGMTRLSCLAEPNANLSQYSKEYLLTKRERAKNVFREYEELTKQILFLGHKDADDDSTEEKYCNVIACIDAELNSRCVVSVSEPTKPPTNQDVSRKMSLPPISIQTFNDTFTARAYQLERDPAAEPSMEDFLKFLEKRALALENAEPGHSQTPTHEARTHRVAAHVVASSPCSYYAVAKPTTMPHRAACKTGQLAEKQLSTGITAHQRAIARAAGRACAVRRRRAA